MQRKTLGKIVDGAAIGAVAICAFLSLYLQHANVPELKINSLQEIEQQPTVQQFLVINPNPLLPIQVGILGDSGWDEKGAFNAAILKKLLFDLKHNKVQAVFFAGNLISGRMKKTSQEDSEHPQFVPIENKEFDLQATEFRNAYQSVMGKIPLFPSMGNREMSVLGGSTSFRAIFELKNAIVFKDDALAYGVSIGPAFFAVITTERYLPDKQQAEAFFNSEMLEWLKKSLAEASKSHHFLFVIGHDPAFPTTSTLFQETENFLKQRDEFWKILVDSHVQAYFASHEYVFDRSDRHGVWQIISGGGGGGGQKNFRALEQQPFFHCLLLKIPNQEKKAPEIQVIDSKGSVVDRFELISPRKAPLYQFQISHRGRDIHLLEGV